MFARLVHIVRPLAITVLLASSLGLALSFHKAPSPAQAQTVDRASVVLRWLDAEQRGDLDTAVAQFAPNAVFIGARVTGACSPQSPCTDLAGITQQLQGNIAGHNCYTIRTLQVSGAVVTGTREIRSDGIRANGVDRVLANFIALVPQGQITFWVTVNDVADPQTALNAAINAGTQPAGTPVPSPATPCPGLL